MKINGKKLADCLDTELFGMKNQLEKQLTTHSNFVYLKHELECVVNEIKNRKSNS